MASKVYKYFSFSRRLLTSSDRPSSTLLSKNDDVHAMVASSFPKPKINEVMETPASEKYHKTCFTLFR